ncbi:MAG: PqqD family protein [Vicinamibacterales bacterium]
MALHLPPDVVYRSLGASGVVVNLRTNQIFELNTTGARIWDLIAGGVPTPEITRALVEEFVVDPETAAAQTRQLVTDLVQHGLLQL